MSYGQDAFTVRRTSVIRSLAGSVVATAAAALASVCLVNGLSYPGFPIDVAVCGVVAAVISMTVAIAFGIRGGATKSGRVQGVVVLALTGTILLAGVFVARADDGQRLRARWAASQAAFEQEVSTAGALGSHENSADTSSLARYPGACPSRIGKFGVAGCRPIDGGFMFLQSQGALTDDSGIVYLPADRPGPTWGDSETMTPLGGPWWSWTCHC